MNMRNLGIITLVSLSITASSGANAAFGFCFAPTAPSVFITKPTKPYCATSRSCSQWQVDSYKRDVERHFRQLKTYLEDVDRFQEEAYDYAKCMADLD